MEGEDDLVLSEDDSASVGQGSFALSPSSRHPSQEELSLEGEEVVGQDEEDDDNGDDYTMPSATKRDDDDYTLEGENVQEGEEEEVISHAISVHPPPTGTRPETPAGKGGGADDDRSVASSQYSEGFNSEASPAALEDERSGSGYASDFTEGSVSDAGSPREGAMMMVEEEGEAMKLVSGLSAAAAAGVEGKQQAAPSQPSSTVVAPPPPQERPQVVASRASEPPSSSSSSSPSSPEDMEAEIATLKTKLEEQKALTASLQAQHAGRGGEASREVDTLGRRVHDVENLLANPTDPNSQLLHRIRSRRDIVSKRNFLTANLKHVETELEKVGQTRSQLESVIEKVTRQIEDKRREEEDGMKERMLEEQVFELSSQAVEEGKKNLDLSRKLVAVKTDLQAVSEDVKYARYLLRRFIAKREETGEGMELPELLSIYNHVVSGMEQEEEEARERAKEMQHHQGGGAGGEEEGEEEAKRLGELERMIEEGQAENEHIEGKITAMEVDLQVARAAWEDVHALQAKVASIKRRYLTEKDERKRAQKSKQGAFKKVVLLSKHIERLMSHIKHEAVAKTRAIGHKRKTLRELTLLRDRGRELSKKMHERDELIGNLQQSARLLEDQLRLMDSRYLELRGKLDYTKSSSEMELRRVQTELDGMVARWNYVKRLFPPGPIEPQELRNKLHSLSRAATADGFVTHHQHDGFSPESPDSQLPTIPETGRGGGSRKGGGKNHHPHNHNNKHSHQHGDHYHHGGKKRATQYEYPSLAEVIKAADPAVQHDGREHLWSQTKIDMLYSKLKHYHKAPVKDVVG